MAHREASGRKRKSLRHGGGCNVHISWVWLGCRCRSGWHGFGCSKFIFVVKVNNPFKVVTGTVSSSEGVLRLFREFTSQFVA